MKIHPTAILLFFLIAIAGCGPNPVDTASKRELAIEMLRVAGFERTILASGPSMTEAWKRSRPDVPKEFWDDNMKDLEAEYAKKLLDIHIDAMVDVYSESDLRAILDFYQTPLGKKLSAMADEIQPKLQTEFGNESARIEVLVRERLKKGGY